MATVLPNRSSSLWLDKTERPRYPELALDDQADVVVVGAGIAGLTTGVQLARAGKRVIVVDRRNVGAVTTGNTTAKATVLHGLRYARIIRKHDIETARAYAAANSEGLRRLLTEARLADAHVETLPAYTYVTDARLVQKVEDEVAGLRSAGISGVVTTETGLPFPVAAAVRVDDQAQLDPILHLDRLAREVVAAGGAVYERAAVVSVRSGAPCKTTTAAGRTLQSDHVILATGMPFTDRGLFFARLEPMRSYGIALPYPGRGPRACTCPQIRLRGRSEAQSGQLVVISWSAAKGTRWGKCRRRLPDLQRSLYGQRNTSPYERRRTAGPRRTTGRRTCCPTSAPPGRGLTGCSPRQASTSGG
jgi:glycine/D-amino acid oxidase-like deaminating enzyme